MKKLLLLIALVAGMNLSMKAQSDEPKVQFGVRAGLNVSSFGGDISKKDKGDMGSSLAGFHIGGIVDINVANNFYIQPGLYVTTKGGKGKESGSDWEYKETARLTYLQIPVLASYRIPLSDNVKWQINAGPYVAFGLAGKLKWTDIDEGDKETGDYKLFGTEKDQEKSILNRFDAGLSFGTGVSITNFYVGVSYDLGLANIYNEYDDIKYSAKNKNFMVSVGYNF